MILSKSEMEDIWANKPVNYLKSYKKDLKKYKTYYVSLRPYDVKYHSADKFKVRSLSKYAAEIQAREEYIKKYNINSNQMPYAWGASVTLG